MIIIHQAIYGDVSGAYALIKTSLNDTKEAKRICNITDMRERPDSTIDWSPNVRGFKFGEYYLLIKSLKDDSPNVRKGRIYSHALIVQLSDLENINDLKILITQLQNSINPNENLQPIIYNKDDEKHLSIHSGTRESCVISSITKLDNYNNCIAWIGKEGYENIIIKIWNNSPVHLRSRLHFGTYFNPKEVNPEYINIVCIPSIVSLHWDSFGYKTITTEEKSKLSSPIELLLAGNKETSKELLDFIEDSSIEIHDYYELEYCNNILNCINNLPNINKLAEVLPSLNQYYNISIDTQNGSDHKAKILAKVIDLFPKYNIEEVCQLRNIRWESVENGREQISIALEEWINKSLTLNKLPDSIFGINDLLLNPTTTWFDKLIYKLIKQYFLNFSKYSVADFWKIIATNKEVANKVLNDLPSDTTYELAITESIPSKLDKIAIDLLEKFAIKNEWAKLFIAINLIKSDINTLLDSLLNNFKNIKPTDIDYLIEKVDNAVIIDFITTKSSIPLLAAGTKILLRNKSLFSNFNASNETWVTLWVEHLNHGGLVTDPLIESKTNIYHIYDLIISNKLNCNQLLNYLSKSTLSDLTFYENKFTLINKLTIDVIDGFRINTIRGTLLGLINNSIPYSLETMSGFDGKLIFKVIKQLVKQSEITISDAINLFNIVSSLNQDDFLELITSFDLIETDAKNAGILIRKRKWTFVANKYFSHLPTGENTYLLEECKELLSIFNRFTFDTRKYLNSRNDDSKSIKQFEDVWQILTKECYKLYPSGPTQNGIWISAGGDNSDLLSRASGKEIWTEAIQGLKTNKYKNITIETLLNTILEENPRNKNIIDLINKI